MVSLYNSAIVAGISNPDRGLTNPKVVRLNRHFQIMNCMCVRVEAMPHAVAFQAAASAPVLTLYALRNSGSLPISSFTYILSAKNTCVGLMSLTMSNPPTSSPSIQS